MPRELVDFARLSGCAAIDDFFDRPGMIDPPYVYGVFAGDKENSAVFWCKKPDKSDKPYLLVIKVANTKDLMGCPTKVEWWNPPGGLSIETRPRLQLSDFHYVADPKRPGPQSTVSKGRVIVSYYDGLSEVFHCYKGEWLVATTE